MTTPYKQPKHKLTMIPGPIEFSDEVLGAMATPSQSHTHPEFIATFEEVLKNLRKVFKSENPKTQPYVLAGSGTLGWDIVGCNLILPGDKVLVLSTGFFSDAFADCLRVYGADLDVVTAEIGDVVPLDVVAQKLKDTKYAALTITHVDTSTSVLSDVKAISELVHKISPETLIVVDGVCAVASEDMEFDKWGIDYALTASQKALGVPAGLSVSFASERAVAKAMARDQTSWFASLRRWTPVMNAYESGKGAYFATPAVQTVTALKVSLQQILDQGMDSRLAMHKQSSTNFKNEMEKLGMKIVPVSRQVAANGLTAVYFPKGVQGPEFLASLSNKGFTVAPGIHKALVGKYFRVGHMGYSLCAGHVDQLIVAIQETVKQLTK